MVVMFLICICLLLLHSVGVISAIQTNTEGLAYVQTQEGKGKIAFYNRYIFIRICF